MNYKEYTGWARIFGKWHYFKNGECTCKRSKLYSNSEQYIQNQTKIYDDELCGWCKQYLKDDSLWKDIITEHTDETECNRPYNFDLLLKLTRDIPSDLDRSIKKETTSSELRKKIIERDKNTCQLCGLQDQFGNPGWDIPGKLAAHHIIPNGPANLDNVITLCRYCHNAVHAILYASGKWRYVPMR
jgi:5-methylcytosine-specific restriction endonuclease McrA